MAETRMAWGDKKGGKRSLFLSLQHALLPMVAFSEQTSATVLRPLTNFRDNWRDESGLKTRTAAEAEGTLVLPCVTGGFVGERAECHRSPVVAAALIRAFAPQQNRHLGRLNISKALVPVDFLLHYPGAYMRK